MAGLAVAAAGLLAALSDDPSPTTATIELASFESLLAPQSPVVPDEWWLIAGNGDGGSPGGSPGADGGVDP